MAEVQVVDQHNSVVGSLQLSDAVFALDANPGLIHRVYTALAQAQRGGTHNTKTRAEVSGGGKKPWKQKGTGRARQGSTRSAQWRHGGVAHGPRSHGYETRINRKERQLAIRLALSDLFREDRLVVVDKLELSEVKTKEFARIVSSLNAEMGLFVMVEKDRNVMLSSRNIPRCSVILDGQVSLHALMKHQRVVMTADAVGRLEERLA
ncbi:MAG: 50S ribosomal protein L4 [Mariprofundales bacterium]|nr:50S ribosomal protein L4 [Mariprofundales bacterium]